jgi:hypothetical protein
MQPRLHGVKSHAPELAPVALDLIAIHKFKRNTVGCVALKRNERSACLKCSEPLIRLSLLANACADNYPYSILLATRLRICHSDFSIDPSAGSAR